MKNVIFLTDLCVVYFSTQNIGIKSSLSYLSVATNVAINFRWNRFQHVSFFFQDLVWLLWLTRKHWASCLSREFGPLCSLLCFSYWPLIRRWVIFMPLCPLRDPCCVKSVPRVSIIMSAYRLKYVLFFFSQVTRYANQNWDCFFILISCS